jgi:hypothetical protein
VCASTARDGAAYSVLRLCGRDLSLVLLDQTIDCGQVGLLRRAFQPGVDLDSLAEEMRQHRVTLV